MINIYDKCFAKYAVYVEEDIDESIQIDGGTPKKQPAIDQKPTRDTSEYTYSTIESDDGRFNIVVNDQTGYYNITKTATLFKKIQEADTAELQEKFDSLNVSDGRKTPRLPQQSARGKRTNAWMRLQDTQAKIVECAHIHNITPDECTFIIDKGRDNAYRGTYIHPMLYDHFMLWLDPIYSMRVSTKILTPLPTDRPKMSVFFVSRSY
jgi:hypothetical protein